MGRPYPLGEDDLGVAVFGGSDAEQDGPLYSRARAIGRALAERGLPVVTGGYGGVMEAASRGAAEGGGEAIGVTCRQFAGRTANEWLTTEIEEADLMTRTSRLFELSFAFIVLEGQAGTLAELGMLWAYHRAGMLARPIVLWDDAWSAMYRHLADAGRLDAPIRRFTFVATDIDQVLSVCAPRETGRS